MNVKKAEYIIGRLIEMSDSYYNGKPIATDNEYDELYQKLMKFEKITGIVLPNSPTHKVGIEGKGSRVRHIKKMYSMVDIHNERDMIKWLDKFKGRELLTELKFDGVSLNITYVDGVLLGGATRGDGEVGEDVPCVRDIIGIPHSIPINGTVEIRGEVIMYKEQLLSINRDREKKNLSTYSNTRNLVSGSVRLKDSDEVIYRGLRFVPWGVGQWYGNENTLSEIMAKLCSIGFEKLSGNLVCTDFEPIKRYYSDIILKRDKLDFDIDGIVIKVNDIETCEEIGYTAKVPKWMCAYKLPAVEKTAKVVSIHTQVSRTGSMCPVATIEPTELNGATITKVTLHNFDYLESKDIRIGDSVVVIRSGDVIPKITKVFKDRRDGSEIIYGIPDECPICGSAVDDSAICTSLECSARVGGLISHYCDCMDILGLGSQTIESLLAIGVSRVLDLYNLSFDELIKIDGFQNKKVNNILTSIEGSKGKRLYMFIKGLGIPNIGYTVGKIIETIDKDIWDITYKDLITKMGIGKEIANTYVKFMDSNKDYIKELYDIVRPIRPTITDIPDNKYKGKDIVLTGSMSVGRNKVKEWLTALGANIRGSVSSNTNLLIYGDKAGSKLTKAKSLGIELLTYDTFISDYYEHHNQ